MKVNRQIHKKKAKKMKWWMRELEHQADYDRQSISALREYILLLQCCGNCKSLKEGFLGKTCRRTLNPTTLHHKCDDWRPNRSLRNDVMTYWPKE
jgi:hypothetical protein